MLTTCSGLNLQFSFSSSHLLPVFETHESPSLFTLFGFQNGNSALSIARRLGYISVVDTLKVVTEETLVTQVSVCVCCCTYSYVGQSRLLH